MQKQTDDQIAVPLVEDIAAHFPAVKSVSMDKSVPVVTGLDSAGAWVVFAVVLGVTCLSACRTLSGEIDQVPGRASFRAPPPPALHASEALGAYLSKTSVPEELVPTRVGKELNLTLVDAIGLALDENTGLKAAYLGRISDRVALAAAEDKFSPMIGLKGSVKAEGGETSTTTLSRSIQGAPQVVVYDDERSRDDRVTWHTSIGPAVTWLLPTGANVQLDLHVEADDLVQRESGTSSSSETDYGYGGNLGFSITQPLLRGAGREVNEASIRRARIGDNQQILGLKGTIETTVSEAIRQYRSVLRIKAEVRIAEEALDSARRNLANNKALVAAGRLPVAGEVQYVTQIRQHQITLKRVRTSLENARRVLARTLGQPLDSRIRTQVFEPRIEQIEIGFARAMAIALSNRSDYKAAQLSKESAEIDLFLAKNNLLWDVELVAGVHANLNDTRSHVDSVGSLRTRSTTRDEQEGWNVGLNFVIPIDDNDQAARAVAMARVASQQADLALVDARQNANLDVRNAITDLNSAWDQIQLSEEAYQLARQQYEIAKKKLEYGRITNFEVISLDNSFQESKVQRLDAKIDYLNAVTALDLALGTTLKTWNIDIGEPGT